MRRQAKSPGRRSWSRTRPSSAAGSIAITLGRCSRSSGSSSWLSVVRATTTRPPTESVLSAQRKEPTCDIEEPGRKASASSSSKAAAALAIIQRSDSRVWVTPLAGPVLPEVKKIAAGSLGSGGGSSGSGSCSSRAAKPWRPLALGLALPSPSP